MHFARRQRFRRLTGVSMSLVMLLFMACQGMAQASTLNQLASVNTVHAAMPDMPGCHQADAAKPVQECHTDCQHLDKAVDTGSATVVWFLATTSWPALNNFTDNRNIISVATWPFHDPVVDPPPTLRFHRFLE
ncbi:MAG TPA: hypothetical protein VLB90_09635 [Pseudomonadales bacterium]|nr:hypothetical protein [Pseudomonadales bacterium]